MEAISSEADGLQDESAERSPLVSWQVTIYSATLGHQDRHHLVPENWCN